MAKISALGLNEWDGTLWDNFVVPQGVNKSDVTNTIMLETADLELLYPDFDTMKAAIGIWSRAELPIWQKLYDTVQLEYNPIWNVDTTETETRGVTESGNRSGNSRRDSTASGSNSGSASTDNKSNSFNSSALVVNDRQETSDSGTSQSTAQETANSAETTSGNRNENITRARKGNMGVSTQSLIKEEREISQFCIEDYIVNSFKRRFCLLVY